MCSAQPDIGSRQGAAITVEKSILELASQRQASLESVKEAVLIANRIEFRVPSELKNRPLDCCGCFLELLGARKLVVRDNPELPSTSDRKPMSGYSGVSRISETQCDSRSESLL